MKYEAEIDLRNANTSHALMVELVGCDRRVLDVGCAAGDLGRVLKRRGCRVAGVEADRAAADAAEKVLDEVLHGDVNDLDLVRHFGKESFDVVVFGDVLEHLADPVPVLRKVRPLLAAGGSVVASIPNVAHGAVRLALLKGDFDYRPLGLLDSTHLRFFTRASLHEVFREAGMVPVDVRRTTAGVFDTEIGLRQSDFEQGVVDAVEGDPESTTYQFVLRAVPEDSPDAIGRPAPQAPPPRAANTRVGVWARVDPDDLGAALVLRVTHAELTRRLRGGAVRCFSAGDDVRPSPHDGGLPVEALGPWSAERARALAGELDCVVLTGELPPATDADRDGGTRPAQFLLNGLGPANDADCPVLWSAVRLPDGAGQPLPAATAGSAYGAVLDEAPARVPVAPPGEGVTAVPDPLFLVPRLLRPDALARRLEFARMMGWFPTDGEAVVVEVDATLLPHAEAVGRALDSAVTGGGASVVLLGRDRRQAAGGDAVAAIAGAMSAPGYRVPGDALVDDVAAVVAGAAAVAARSPLTLTLALAYGVPAAHVDLGGDPTRSPIAAVTGDAGVVATRAEDLARLLDRDRFAPPAAGVVAALQARLDAHFDRLAAIADSAAAARSRTPDSRPVLPPSEYVAAMELAHRRMQQRLDAERRAVAEHLGGLRRRHREELAGSKAELERLRAERVDLEVRLERATADSGLRDECEERLRRDLAGVVAELEALKGIRVLRLLRPARAVYARLRGSRL